MAANYTIEIHRGATWAKTLTWYTDEEQTTPQNLTSYTALLSIKEREGADVILDITDAAGITLGGAAGTIAIVFSKTQTRALPKSKELKYALELDLAGVTTRLMEGALVTDEEIAL